MHMPDHIVVHVPMTAASSPASPCSCSLLVPLLTEYDGVIRELSQQGEVYKVCTCLGHWEMMEWRCVLRTCITHRCVHRVAALAH